MSKLNVPCKILDTEFFEQFDKPEYQSKYACGVDLRANLDNKDKIILQPGETALINTGFAIFLNNPHYAAFIYPRSGQGHKRGIVLGNLVGVIDADYQGEIKVSLWNRSNEPQVIMHGERIAQLVVQTVHQLNLDFVDEFITTERGENGFGSTGTN